MGSEIRVAVGMPRFVGDTDLARGATFLASPQACPITGHDLVVDSGWDG